MSMRLLGARGLMGRTDHEPSTTAAPRQPPSDGSSETYVRPGIAWEEEFAPLAACSDPNPCVCNPPLCR